MFFSKEQPVLAFAPVASLSLIKNGKQQYRYPARSSIHFYQQQANGNVYSFVQKINGSYQQPTPK
jgi:hypothetical protein